MLLLLLWLVQTTQPSRSLGPSVNELPNTSPRVLPSHGASSAAPSLLGGRMHGVDPPASSSPAASSSHGRCSLLSPRLMVRLIPGRIWIYKVAEKVANRKPQGREQKAPLPPARDLLAPHGRSAPTPHVLARGHPVWGEAMPCSCSVGCCHGRRIWLAPQV